MTLELRYILVRCNYVWKRNIQLRCVFSHHCDVVLLRHNYIIYLLDRDTLFHDVIITLYFGMSKIRMEIALQLRFVFARHCGVFFVTSQLHHLFARCSYVFSCRYNGFIFWFVRITYGN